MTNSSSPLISRLRDRIFATTWLFAFLVVMKMGLAAACFANDDQAVPSSAAVSGAVVDATANAVAIASVTASDGDDESCWHAGSGGCHCTCAHAAALSIAWQHALPSYVRDTVFPSATDRSSSVSLSSALRPPIA